MRPNPSAFDYLFFGRRKGRPLRAKKTELMHTLLPPLAIHLSEQGYLDVASLYQTPRSGYWLEIGFGSGEHLAELARRHPDYGYLGCEPFRNGIAGLLEWIEREKLSNIRIFPDDARKLLDNIQPNSLDRCYLLFADPWPKSRHEDRRFISHANLIRLARVLKFGAQFWLATDDERLKAWTLSIFKEHPEFVELYKGDEPPKDWINTRYEEKALKAGRRPLYLIYQFRSL